MPYPHEHRHACILFIDIFVDIIDNYGDIGWVEELMRASYTKIRYRIVTSTPELVSAFLLRNTVDEKLYRICPQKEYIPLGASPVVILSFHKKINPRLFPSHTLFLRVNYLSFQSFAQDIHLRHHIDSTSTRPIIELSYSPLSHTGGIIKGIDTEINRQEWLLSVGLDSTLSDKKWRMIFVYNATFARLDFDEENTVYFIIGRKSTQPSNQLTSIPAHQHPSSSSPGSRALVCGSF